MLLATTVLLLTAAINLLLGAFVIAYNPDRLQNRRFAHFSATMGLWALCIAIGANRSDPVSATLWIRLSCAVATLIPLTFFLLCYAILSPTETQRSALRRYWPLALLTALTAVMALHPALVRGVTLPAWSTTGMGFPEPQYGPLFLPYHLYFLIAFVWIMVVFIRGLLRTTGVQHTELQFVLIGMLLTMGFSLSTQVVLPMLTGSGQTQPLGPLGGLAMNLVIAYGIATRRLMDATGMLRQLVAYGLLTAYLLVIFFLTHMIISRISPAPGLWPQAWASLIAALIVAISMAPAQAYLQRVTGWFFASSRHTRLAGAVDALSTSLQTIATMPELIGSFAGTIGSLTGTDRVMLLLERKRAFEQVYPPETPGHPPMAINVENALARRLRSRDAPLVADELLRERQTPDVRALRDDLHAADAAMALGIRARGQLIGILLLGVRKSGRIYGRDDQHNLQMLCNHLGVAIENARLYTESVQNRLHSVTLLNNLVNGVIATDAEGEITMINLEAQRLCRLAPEEHQPLRLGDLPPPLEQVLRRTLEHGRGERDLDAELPHPGGVTLPIRIGTSPFHDPDGRIMGALAVLSDLTTVRKLEAQIRRTDRLASVGTLAAGMAHEIKNPLVTINTFTQLLPERYGDADFRSTFTELMQHEVQRMNSLVNQLLRFARPAPPLLAPVRLNEVLSHSLLLMEQQIRNHRVQLETHLAPADVVIRADSNQLEQAFVNFILNALQAMPAEGRLVVSLQAAAAGAGPRTKAGPAAEVRIQDSGCGIAAEHLNHIFDPFFTTRSEGTGLGLSVAHGIIVEHNGAVEVESTVGTGTTFTMTFPLVTPGAPS